MDCGTIRPTIRPTYYNTHCKKHSHVLRSDFFQPLYMLFFRFLSVDTTLSSFLTPVKVLFTVHVNTSLFALGFLLILLCSFGTKEFYEWSNMLMDRRMSSSSSGLQCIVGLLHIDKYAHMVFCTS